jgi:hypothetical protein
MEWMSRILVGEIMAGADEDFWLKLSGTCLRHVVSVSCVTTDALKTRETS